MYDLATWRLSIKFSTETARSRTTSTKFAIIQKVLFAHVIDYENIARYVSISLMYTQHLCGVDGYGRTVSFACTANFMCCLAHRQKVVRQTWARIENAVMKFMILVDVGKLCVCARVRSAEWEAKVALSQRCQRPVSELLSYRAWAASNAILADWLSMVERQSSCFVFKREESSAAEKLVRVSAVSNSSVRTVRTSLSRLNISLYRCRRTVQCLKLKFVFSRYYCAVVSEKQIKGYAYT